MDRSLERKDMNAAPNPYENHKKALSHGRPKQLQCSIMAKLMFTFEDLRQEIEMLGLRSVKSATENSGVSRRAR
jgi:hypothetical protein